MAKTSEIYKTWTQLKAFIVAPKKLELQYHENGTHYRVFVVEAGVEYFTELWTDTSLIKGIDVTQNTSDLTDFEDNYKTNANQAIKQDVNVDNDIIIGDFSSGLNLDIGQVNVEEGQMLIYGLPDASGEPLKGAVSVDEKSGGRFELAITDVDVVSKLSDIEERYGQIYDDEENFNRLPVDSLGKTKICGETSGEGFSEPVNVILDKYGTYRLAVDADIRFEDNAVVAIDNITRRIWDGYVFEYSDIFSKQIDDTQEYLISIPTGYQLHIFWELSSELGITFELYESPTITNNGSSITMINANRNSTNVPNTSMYNSPTYSAMGTRIRATLLSGSNQSAGRGESREIILKENTTYLVVVTSKGNGNSIGYQQTLYEREI